MTKAATTAAAALRSKSVPLLCVGCSAPTAGPRMRAPAVMCVNAKTNQRAVRSSVRCIVSTGGLRTKTAVMFANAARRVFNARRRLSAETCVSLGESMNPTDAQRVSACPRSRHQDPSARGSAGTCAPLAGCTMLTDAPRVSVEKIPMLPRPPYGPGFWGAVQFVPIIASSVGSSTPEVVPHVPVRLADS